MLQRQNSAARRTGALPTRPDIAANRVGKIAQLRTMTLTVPGNFAHPTPSSNAVVSV
jgi:hypothetical protein